jgi:hypothetical protein
MSVVKARADMEDMFASSHFVMGGLAARKRVLQLVTYVTKRHKAHVTRGM